MSLKDTTARTVKWNTINSVATQVLYALVGVVLANILTREDYGLVGVLLIFQAFAMVLVDSGLGAALLQRKSPTETDYSTVFWFNLLVSTLLYALLYFASPLIADIFQGDGRLIPLGRVMFLALIINALGIIQTNRLMKRMDVRQVAVSNTVGLVLGGAVGIWSAASGYGAWALVWQTLILSAVKSGWLWVVEGWRPRAVFSMTSLRGIARLGASVCSTSLLNTLFLQAYSFVTGAFYSMASLGVYSQGDKWSKMGSASISQILTSSFVPLLAGAQDDAESFHRYVERINRFTALVLLPAMCGMAVLAEPIFHTLFAGKWDAAIPLFAILSIRGIGVVLVSLCTNYLLSLGYGKRLMWIELVKDGAIAVAILCTIWWKDLTLLVWGQCAATALTLCIVAPVTGRVIGYGVTKAGRDMRPAFVSTLAACAAAWCVMKALRLWVPLPASEHLSGAILLAAGALTGAGAYLLALRLSGVPELKELMSLTAHQSPRL